MPSANTALHERALRRAHAHESVELVWVEGDGLAFTATKNRRAAATEEESDRNAGDNTACALTALVAATATPEEPDGELHPDNLPEQGHTFTDAAGRRYRVASVDYAPGLPKITFHVPNVIAP